MSITVERDAYVCMTEQCTQRFYVNILLNRPCSECVAQGMECRSFDLKLLKDGFKVLLHRFWLTWFAFLAALKQKIARILAAGKLACIYIKVFQEIFRHGNAALGAFGFRSAVGNTLATIIW